MTNWVDNLEAARLVECQVVDEALLAHLANEERLLSGLSAGERKQLTDLLPSCSCPSHSLGCVQLAPAPVTSESPPRRRGREDHAAAQWAGAHNGFLNQPLPRRPAS